MLRQRRLLITGVVDTRSIAFGVMRAALDHGAEVMVAALPRDRDRAVEAVGTLDVPIEVVDLDLTDAEQVESVTERVRSEWGHLDGVLHAVAFAPQAALAGGFLEATEQDATRAFATSTVTYAATARLLAELAPERGGSLVGLDFDASAAWPVYNWMGVCKAGLESASRYIARDLGPRGIRSNLLAAGPLHTRAAGGIPDFDRLLDAWEQQAPLQWDPHDHGPVADAACFLLSDLSRAVTGEILHVDGGYHAMAAPLN